MTIVLTWFDADNEETVLDDTTGYVSLTGAIGLGAPTPLNTIDPYNAFDGGALVKRRQDVKQVVLPMLVEHATRVETGIGDLARKFRGPGILQWADGTHTRYLRNVVYESGLQGDHSNYNPLWRYVVVSLLALDPWWYESAQSTALSTTGGTPYDANIAYDADIPYDGGDSVSVIVESDDEVFPIVTVDGPATTLTVSSDSLGWSIAAPLAAGQVLTVDTRPSNRGPRLNGGPVDWSLLTAPSRLWTWSAPGTKSIVTGVSGATDQTTIVVQWEPRFLTP